MQVSYYEIKNRVVNYDAIATRDATSIKYWSISEEARRFIETINY